MIEPEMLDTHEGVAVVVPPHLCKPAAAAIRRTIDDIEKRTRRRVPPALPDLAARLEAAGRLTESGERLSLAKAVRSRPGGWLTVSEVAAAKAVTRQAVTAACRSGRLAGAWQIDGRTWLVPITALEEQA